MVIFKLTIVPTMGLGLCPTSMGVGNVWGGLQSHFHTCKGVRPGVHRADTGRDTDTDTDTDIDTDAVADTGTDTAKK